MISGRSQRAVWVLSAAAFLLIDCESHSDHRVERDGSAPEYRPSRPHNYDSLDFFDLINLGSFYEYFQPQGLGALASNSQLVVTGKLLSIAEGRTLGGPKGTPSIRISTSVAEVQVESGVKGTDGRNRIFVEFWHSQVVASTDLMAKLPKTRMIFFLFDATNFMGKDYSERDVFDKGKGLPKGETLWNHWTPLGLIVETDTGLVFPLEPDKSRWLNLNGNDFDGVVSTLSKQLSP